MSEVQHITPINDGGLEDYVDNNLTLTVDEYLIEITKDFSQFQDIMDYYLVFLDRISCFQKK
jgi:hypothetical protein